MSRDHKNMSIWKNKSDREDRKEERIRKGKENEQ